MAPSTPTATATTTTATGPGSAWTRFLEGRHAPVLTHGSLLGLTAMQVGLLVWWPGWWVLIPGVAIQHRIGILLHEYIHSIPFRRRKANLAVLQLWDGLGMTFGLLEVFRNTHLAHHRWLNSDRDPAFETAQRVAQANGRVARWLTALEVSDLLANLRSSARGRGLPIKLRRVATGMALSIAWGGLWWLALDLPRVPWALWGMSLVAGAVLSSLRGAVEHHGHPEENVATHEYRALIPMFNLNRHVHHHQQPGLPWYRLQWRTAQPLPPWTYYTHWVKVYVTGKYVMLRPPPERGLRTEES